MKRQSKKRKKKRKIKNNKTNGSLIEIIRSSLLMKSRVRINPEFAETYSFLDCFQLAAHRSIYHFRTLMVWFLVAMDSSDSFIIMGHGFIYFVFITCFSDKLS